MADNKPSEEQIFQEFDKQKIKEEIKKEAVEEAQSALIKRLQGNKKKFSWQEKGKEKPDNYDELFEEVDKRAVSPDKAKEIARKEFEELQKQKDEENLRKQKKEREKQAKTIRQTKENFDKEWYRLVREGKMPAPAKKIQEKIDRGETLSRDEILNDEGLKARLELNKYSKNKHPRIAYYEDYRKEPVGKSAPVFGSRPSAPFKESQELKYDDVAKERKKLFGF